MRTIYLMCRRKIKKIEFKIKGTNFKKKNSPEIIIFNPIDYPPPPKINPLIFTFLRPNPKTTVSVRERKREKRSRLYY
jgi:hypothetical protein